MAPSLALLAFGLPALLALAAALLGAAGRGIPARLLALAAAGAALAVALAGPDGPVTVPWLLLGATGGLDPGGRLGLAATAAALVPALGRAAAADPGDVAWRALLAAGVALGAVAFDAGTQSMGLVAAVAGAHGLARREDARAAAVFLAFGILGQVLLVDALAQLGHGAESARLDAMREAARAEAGDLAAWLHVAAFGLPLALAGTGGAPSAVAALAVLGVVAILRVGAAGLAPGEPWRSLARFAAIGIAAAAAGRLLARLPARWGGAGAARQPTAGHGHGAEPAAAAPPAAAGAALAWLAAGERRLLAAGATGALLLALIVALALLLGR